MRCYLLIFLSLEFEVFHGDDMVVSRYIALSLRGSAMDGEVPAAKRDKSQKSQKSQGLSTALLCLLQYSSPYTENMLRPHLTYSGSFYLNLNICVCVAKVNQMPNISWR